MRLPASFGDASIRRKLMFIVFLATVAAMLCAVLLLSAQQWFQLRNELLRNVYAQASIVAANSTSALVFNDREAAEQTLGALAPIDNIEFAGLLDKTGKDFAFYVRPGLVVKPHQHTAADEDGRIHAMTYVDVAIPIVLKQERIGTIHVRSSMKPVYQELAWSVLTIVVAAAAALLVAVMLVLRLLPAITDPLQYLVGLMSAISRDKNYTLRAEMRSKDEVGTLARGFNSMLSQIQMRDDALAQHRQDLEGEVAQRTAELKEANLALGKELAERKAAEQELQAANEQLSILLDSLPIAVYRCRAEGDYAVMYMSHNVVSFTGYEPSHFIEESDLWLKRIHPDDASRVTAGMTILFEKGMHAYEYRWQHADGNYRWILDSLRLIRPEDGTPSYMVGMWQDITERKLAEEKIRKQQELTSRIIETIPLRVFWKDRDLRYMGCNTLFAKDAGLSRPAELIGRSDFDMGWKDQAELYRADDQRVMDSRTPRLSYDEPQTTPDGRQIWLRSSKVPLLDEANESIGVLGVYEDITEHKLAAQALEESELKFRTILDSAVDGILVAEGGAHKFVIANRAICDMLGYSPEEIYRLGVEDIHPAEALSHVQQQFERQMKGEIQVALNLPVKRRDGSVFYADVSSSPMVLAGRPYLIGVFHDVTERRQAEEKVREINEELEEKVRERTQQLLAAQEDLVRKEKLAVLGQVAGSVGHELRNPLGVMNNAVYFLQTVLSDGDDTVKEYLAMIKEEITGAERIVSDLLDSVRTKPPQPEAVGVAELIGQVLRTLSVPAGVAVQLDIPATLPHLQVDPLQVQQVFRNLISNGIDAMAQGGTLEIRATEADEGKAIAVSVRDTGCGIVPAQMARLFQPLFTTKARGIGLGLVVVKNLTEANGGRIEVQSEPGKGTVFSITLPCVDSPAGEA